MTLRRVLIFAAIVLGIATVLAIVAPVDENSDEPSGSAATTPPPPRGSSGDDVVIKFDAAAEKVQEERVPVRTRVILRVRVPKPGQVVLSEKGRDGGVQAAEPGTPAVFDLFLDEPQELDVTFTPAGGELERVGTVVVKG